MLKIEGITVKGISCCVPSNVEDNSTVAGYDNLRKQKIIQTTGVHYRRIAEKNTCTSDLVLFAAKNLIKKLNVDVNDIGILIFATQTPDYILPATSHIIHKELGLASNVITYDMNLGCSAYIYGLFTAASMLKVIPQKLALVLAGDTISEYAGPEDAATRFLFGDAGTATLLETSDTGSSMYFSLGSDGEGWRNLIIPAGGARNKFSPDSARVKYDQDGNGRSEEHLFMDGMEIFNFTISTVVPHLREIMNELGMPEVTVFHQANRYMLEFMRKNLKISKENFLYSLAEYGNTSSASIPLTLCMHNSQSDKFSKVLLSGFGVGYSWGSAVLNLSNTIMLEITELKG